MCTFMGQREKSHLTSPCDRLLIENMDGDVHVINNGIGLTAWMPFKGKSRMCLLQICRSLEVQGELLKTFYDTVMALGWGSSISAGNKKKLNKQIETPSSVLWCPLKAVEVVSHRRMLAKLSSLLEITSHPMQTTLKALSSSVSDRLATPTK